MKQFRKGDRVRRTAASVWGGPTKGHIYTVSKAVGLDTIQLEGMGETWFDAVNFDLEPSRKPGMEVGAFVRRVGPGRADVVSGGVYQIESFTEYAMKLVGCEGSYCFGKFEVIASPAPTVYIATDALAALQLLALGVPVRLAA